MDKNIIWFDLETTGKSTTKDRIVSLSAIKTNQSLDILEKKKILVNPTINIPEEATAIHKITNEMVIGLKGFNSYARGIAAYFNGSILGGYNIAKFDIPILSEELLRCDLELSVEEIIDGCDIFHKREPRNLEAALKFYCGKILEGAHDAENDNIASIDVFRGQIQKYDLKINEWFYTKDESIVDYSRKLKLIDGVICYNFGQHINKPVINDKSYAWWVLENDFPLQTKNIIKKLFL